MTKDEQVVIHHDGSLMRTAGVEAEPKDYNYDEMPPFKREIELHFSDDKDSHYKVGDDEHPKYCLLEDLFKISEGKYISIDMKDTHDGPNEKNGLLKKKVSELVRKYKREDLTIWGAMSNSSHQ